MIKILIVDDEDYIRQGMRYTIPWEDYGMEIIAEASNGEEALKIAVRLKPDIVLADIQMPVMNGLKLASELGTLMPEIKVIILTAYGNTENLTGAIDVKVSAFLLKSADSQKILETVLNVKKEIEVEQKQHEKIEQLKNIYDENRHLIKATLLSRYILKQISLSDFLNKAEKIELDITGDSFSLVLIKCNYDNEKLAIGSFIHSFQDYQPFAFFIQDQLAIIILKTQIHPIAKKEMDELLPGILPLTFGNCIVVMNQISSYEDFPVIYQIMVQALDHCFWNSETLYTLLSPADKFVTESAVNTYSLESGLIAHIITQNISSINTALAEYYSYMAKRKVSRQLFIDSIRRLVVLISAISDEDIDILKINELIDELETPGEIIDLIASLAIPSSDASFTNTQINAALQYINGHYTEDLYLEDVAKVVYLSAGYLSRIFKGETGCSFKEYVHKLRISKAQQLICQTNLKYYEIAEKVGYKNYKYFSSYFNKISGCSAKEYRIFHSH
ncbi:response regulator transcription factor [Anaerocolumna sp. MB42-C2]|uniref:response regulator transcription factor n=1 Tax=Anaerocolumna sp. MB42-C2 TaxID=3070997 RepID=UPI0027DF2C47|nr:response regulator [Anaerocolumna sp. MB42-C2]WMJ86910.1 response regulator [Anaerocolumna sp. MB42-C2]